MGHWGCCRGYSCWHEYLETRDGNWLEVTYYHYIYMSLKDKSRWIWYSELKAILKLEKVQGGAKMDSERGKNVLP